MEHDQDPHGIFHKANKTLYLVLIALIFIAWRCWHLAVVLYDEKVEEALRPQRKTTREPSKRSTIRDRFNIPMAVNQVSYRAVILYSDLRSIPTIGWEKDLQGIRNKKFLRKEHIKNLSNLLAKELQLDAHRLEDLIHSKASFYAHLPYIIKEDLTEKEYYRLKILEKDWAGLHMQRFLKGITP